MAIDTDLKTWANAQGWKLSDESDVEIEVGEQIVTSYTSSKYVQGILIGYISEINDDANNLTRSGYLTPVVDFEHLQEVLVITQRKSDMIEE